MEQGNINLIGCNWLSKLNLLPLLNDLSEKHTNHILLNNLLVVSSEENSIESILEKHKHLFSSDLGLVKDIKVQLSLKEGAKPLFFKAHPVPYVFRKSVDSEIDKTSKRRNLGSCKILRLGNTSCVSYETYRHCMLTWRF